jgi:hypothetical protein
VSSNFDLDASSSQFQVVFDAALNEYSRKTGKAIDSDPLTIELRTCRSSNEVYEVLQEQAQKFNEFRNGDRAVQIMRKLRPTVDILIKLSNGGVLDQGISLVWVGTYPLRVYSNSHSAEFSTRTSDRGWHWDSTRSPYSFTLYFSHCFDTQIRLSRTLAQVMTRSWTYSNVWATISDAWGHSLRFRLPWRES